MSINMRQVRHLSDELDKKITKYDGLNNYIEGVIEYPKPLNYDGVIREVATEAELLTAISNSATGDVIKLTANIDLTAQLVINKSIKIDADSDYYMQSANDGTAPVSLVSVTANDVYITDKITIKHRKTTNTSVEVCISSTGERFISNANVEYMEFAYNLQKSFAIGGKITYTGSLANNHYGISVVSVLSPSIINGVIYSSPSEATGRLRFITVPGTGNFNSNLKVSNCFPENNTYLIRQFYLQEGFASTGGASLIFENNYSNDASGFIGLYDGTGALSPLDFFDFIALICNRQGNAGIANYKGIFFVDGTGSGVALGNTNFYSIGNASACPSIRVTNTSLFGSIEASYTTTAFVNSAPVVKKTNVQVENSIFNYIQGVTQGAWISASYSITTGTTAGNSQLTLLNGTLSNGGVTTKTGDNVACATSDIFNKDTFIVEVNGVSQVKSVDINFVSNGIISFTTTLDTNDIIVIKDFV